MAKKKKKKKKTKKTKTTQKKSAKKTKTVAKKKVTKKKKKKKASARKLRSEESPPRLATPPPAPSERVSDDILAARTGKSWETWFRLLNRAGAEGLSHDQIVTLLYEKHAVTPWWAQMVTVGFESVHGLDPGRERLKRPRAAK